MSVLTSERPSGEHHGAPVGRARRGAPALGLAILTGGAARLWLVALLAAGWEIGTRVAKDPFFPPPSTIMRALHEIWFSGPVTQLFLTDKAIDDFRPSFINLFGGWALAAVGGVVLGIVIGRSQAVGDVLDPLLQFGRSIPPPTLIPFFIVVFDLGTPMQVATIAFGVVWPVLLNTIEGVRTVDSLQLQTAQVFGITGAQRLRRIILPASAPKIFAGLRVSLGFALILMVISELIGSTTGIGAHLINSQQSLEMPEMWAGIAALGILGCLFNAVFVLVERRFLAWHHGARRLDS
ncbi:ABC transporter permease [Actinomadura sp. HBU206391]|uniref:ABC transporter permease n=1 Tax=Actinomadura sp. HBU206391 TaxID=2731692 RepID=UPI00164F788A|nr:ABC transporter permease [Actinomadura sp. HBU206391]MBC6462577.1 ABC transporter permease [Actinomadura sp. HBU206391]